MKILLAVDGSKQSMAAVNSFVKHADWYRGKPVVELVTVHLPLPKLPRMSLVVGKNQIKRYYEEEGQARLAQARKRLRAARIAHTASVLVGPVAQTLVQYAAKSRCDLIVMGTRGLNATAGLFLGSTATKVLALSQIPVLLHRPVS